MRQPVSTITCLTPIHPSRLTVTTDLPQASARCCSRATEALSACCRHCPHAGQKARCADIKARGNFEIDQQWSDGLLDACTIRSLSGNEVTVTYKDIANATITDLKGRPVKVKSSDSDTITFDTQKGASFTINFTR